MESNRGSGRGERLPFRELARRPRTARRNAGVSLAAAAQACSLHERSQRRIESGHDTLPTPALAVLAGLYGTSCNRLLRTDAFRPDEPLRPRCAKRIPQAGEGAGK